MSTGKQNPLGVNVNGSLLQNIGFYINPIAESHMGVSKINAAYIFGSLVQDTVLRLLTWSIHDAYNRGKVAKTPAGTSVYDNLISIGLNVIPALGNAKPDTYRIYDPSGRWPGYATTGYANGVNPEPYPNMGQGQSATWIPYNMTNANSSITMWGFIRCYALQAWNEFNWNGIPTNSVEYKDFCSSFLTAQSFIDYSNAAINALKHSQTFLKGTYSNMNDLITADITGVSLATQAFGQDCITAGKVIDLTKILKFGLPSVLLQTIKKYNTLTQSLVLALLSAGLTNQEIDEISRGVTATPSKLQEKQIYGAFLIIVGQDLTDILIPLNCKTQGLESLADLLNIKKLFPNSYKSLTVPIYNASPGPTNAKTYYPIFEGNAVSPRLETSAIKEQIGTIIPPGEPPVIPKPPPPPPPPAPPPVIPPIIVPADPVLPPPPPPAPIPVPAVVPVASPPPTSPPALPPLPIESGGGGCVVLESYVPLVEDSIYNGSIINQAYQLCQGHRIKLANETTLESTLGQIKVAINELQPCLRITTEDGTSLVCSTTAPIPTLENGVVKAPKTLLEKVGVLRDNKSYWSTVIKVEDVGVKFVRAIDTGNNSFWAGEIEGAYILHHNMSIAMDYAKISKD